MAWSDRKSRGEPGIPAHACHVYMIYDSGEFWQRFDHLSFFFERDLPDEKCQDILWKADASPC